MDFRANWRPIGYLSILLVIVTALGIGLITWLILPVPFALAFAFGAVVAPPDAVAATTIARRVGMPRQLVTILEGESLLNDATAITCVRVGLVAIASTVTAGEVAAGFVVAAVGGGLVGFAVAALATAVRKRITQPVFDTAISFMVPWAAYLPAEEIAFRGFHGSGVIATVVAGLILGHKSAGGAERSVPTQRAGQLEHHPVPAGEHGVPADRPAGPQIINNMGTTDLPASRIAAFCLAVLLGVMIIRMVWVLDRAGPAAVPGQGSRARPPWSYSIVLGWAGLRGVVTLATALLIPIELDDRDVLVFGAMIVVAGTLLIQGLTLPHLVRRLGLRGPDPRSDALQAATVLQTASNAALTELDAITGPDDDPDVIQRVRDRIAARPEALWERLGSDDSQTPAEEYRRLRLATITTERAEVLRIRSTGTIDHAVIEEVLGSLDVEESMLTLASERAEFLDEGGPVEVPRVEEGPCHDLDDAPSDTAPTSDRLRGLRARGHPPRPPADVPDLRQRGLLRLLGEPARHPALPADRPPGDAQLRGRRDLALVLPARATGLIRRPTRPDRPVDEVRSGPPLYRCPCCAMRCRESAEEETS